ncbi:fungal-specific transcription factor domain-containing protein [Aspergillus parasiticus]|uniref:Fungal-specific transcription factor domain-containing protein n=1 Tax=Aspergillus parasiticus TaxID=5067 RepID=A0A5N6DFY7_ASPPA|nr:fungal-specific transcription factor domain-containing protein [Aspergillus parasiticus]
MASDHPSVDDLIDRRTRTVSTDSPRSTRSRRHIRSSLPTRVSSACERCRLHKSRCDPFRPCTLCVRANVDCQALPAQQKDAARNRVASRRTLRNSRRQSKPHRIPPAEQPPDGEDSPRHEVEVPDANAPGADFLPADEHSARSAIDCGEAESAMGLARKICELGSQHIDERTTFAIPGYRASTSAPVAQSAVAGQRLPISSILGQPLPIGDLMYELLEEYFDAIHWFSLVVYEPKFRRRLRSIEDGSAYPSQKPFLLLLAVMLGMAAWYRSQRNRDTEDTRDHWRQWSADLIKIVEVNLVELMDQPSVTAVQTCILLGSHHVYHGRPNLSFALLGATIKMSQALGMHREPVQGEFGDIEERKRVWWTIYTWDRFASITYGRPLGINDKDCNLSMPADMLENPSFTTPGSSDNNMICYSAYQRELNRLYLIASPALEAVFGSRTFRTSQPLAGNTYASLVKHATQELQRWRVCLPAHLALDLERDYHPDGEPGSRAHALQSLSLQLTYDNVLIVLHRPLLARQVDHLTSTTRPPHGSSDGGSPASHPAAASSGHSTPGLSFETPFPTAQAASSDLWMNAAVRTARVTEMPVLAQLATDSHLVAFLAINLFNAAIVLVVMALSEPLSDTAQVVKRTITRILRLQDLIGTRSALSKQSTTVLKNVVTMLLRRESEVIFGPITGYPPRLGHHVTQDPTSLGRMSVEDTLRLPLDGTMGLSDPVLGNHIRPDPGRAVRLNESLTTVHHVLPPGNDRSVNILSGENHQTHQTPNQNTESQFPLQVPMDYGWDGAGAVPMGVEDPYLGNGESGMYWLWDMTWDGMGG